jgi:hypothetical protein
MIIIDSIINGITTLGSAWVESKTIKMKAKAELEQIKVTQSNDYDITALEASKTSWKDELITIIFFSPFVMAWFYPEKADSWIAWVQGLPIEYWGIISGIVAASFGLRWMFERRANKVVDK